MSPIPVDPNAREDLVLKEDQDLPEDLQARFSIKYPRESARRKIEAAVYGEISLSEKPLQLARLVIGETLDGWHWPVIPDDWTPEAEEAPTDIEEIEFRRDRKTRQISDECYELLKAEVKLQLMGKALDMMGLKLKDQD